MLRYPPDDGRRCLGKEVALHSAPAILVTHSVPAVMHMSSVTARCGLRQGHRHGCRFSHTAVWALHVSRPKSRTVIRSFHRAVCVQYCGRSCRWLARVRPTGATIITVHNLEEQAEFQLKADSDVMWENLAAVAARRDRRTPVAVVDDARSGEACEERRHLCAAAVAFESATLQAMQHSKSDCEFAGCSMSHGPYQSNPFFRKAHGFRPMIVHVFQ